MSIYWANAIAFCVGLVVNVILIRRFVFTDSRFRLITDLKLSFVSHGAMFGVGMVILSVLVEFMEGNVYVAKLISNGTTFLMNYLIRTHFFRTK